MQNLDEEAMNRFLDIAAVDQAKAEQIQNIIISKIQKGTMIGQINVDILEYISEQTDLSSMPPKN